MDENEVGQMTLETMTAQGISVVPGMPNGMQLPPMLFAVSELTRMMIAHTAVGLFTIDGVVALAISERDGGTTIILDSTQGEELSRVLMGKLNAIGVPNVAMPPIQGTSSVEHLVQQQLFEASFAAPPGRGMVVRTTVKRAGMKDIELRMALRSSRMPGRDPIALASLSSLIAKGLLSMGSQAVMDEVRLEATYSTDEEIDLINRRLYERRAEGHDSQRIETPVGSITQSWGRPDKSWN